MPIPLTYNLRSLLVRKTTTAMTALGIALTVAVLVSVLALTEGLRTSFKATGHPLNILVTRRGATSEMLSIIPRSSFLRLRAFPGIATTPSGERMASLEVITAIALKNRDNVEGVNTNVRGLLPVGLAMREKLKIVSGRNFTPGHREVIVGRSVAARYPGAALGKSLKFGRGEWPVVGIFDAGRSALNGEILGDLNQIAADYGRSEALSTVLIRATGEVDAQALKNQLETDRSLNVAAQSEVAYYESQMTSALPLQFMGTLIAVIMAVGSSFAAMNTMYAAVARRSAEIGTLRVLGFSRGAILVSFFVESLILAAFGGALGVLLALPLNNLETGISSFTTFSEIVFSFRVSPPIMVLGICFALLVGAAGGLLPAGSAARKQILASLRQV